MNVALLNLDLGRERRAFRYRRGTGDEAQIVQVLKNGGLNFGILRHGKAIAGLYGRMIETGKTPIIVDADAGIGAAAVYFARSFSQARVIAIESDQSNFELLAANTAGLPIECLYAALTGSPRPDSIGEPGEGVVPASRIARVTMNQLVESQAEAALPFIVKIDIERSDETLFVADAEWIGRTPIVVVALRDCLIPGTKKLRAFVEHIAGRNRDFVYLHDNIFSIDRELVVA